MIRSVGRRLALLLAAVAALALSGCGDDEGMPAGGTGGDPGEGGALVWTLGAGAEDVDPLLASTRAERLAAAQVFEPLIEELRGPFGDTREVSGLVRRARPTGDATIWRLNLREGVRFQDGARFNAAAVLANVARWQAADAGGELLPAGLAVDAPRPHLVRFILPEPEPALDGLLSSPRLGIVSPRALGPDPAELAAEPITSGGVGTGAFELRERAADRLLLALNPEWWGRERGLGPALDRVELLLRPSRAERFALLADGSAQAADGLGPRARRRIDSDPLLTALPQGEGRWRGLERSVRGVESGDEIPALHRVWLTRIDR